MQVNMKWDNVALIRRLEKGERRLGFAAINTVNGGAKDVQEAQKVAIQERATVRVPQFTLRQIAIIAFASVSKGKAFAEVYIGRKPRSILPLMETGGLKEHKGRNVAIPVTGEEARPTFQTAQPFPPLVKRLKFRKPRRRRGGRPAGKLVFQGEEGRFLIPGEGIFKRTGDQVRAVVVYKPEVKVKPVLGWMDRARRVAEASMRERMEREAINAIGRAG